MLYLSEMEVVFTKAKNLSGTAASCYMDWLHLLQYWKWSNTIDHRKLRVFPWINSPKIFIYPSHSQKKTPDSDSFFPFFFLCPPQKKENCTVLRTQTYNRSLSYMDKTDVNLCLNNAVTFSIINSMLRQTDMLWQTNPNAQCYYILIHAWTML